MLGPNLQLKLESRGAFGGLPTPFFSFDRLMLLLGTISSLSVTHDNHELNIF